MKSKTADTDGTIIEFMQGSHSYDGIWFGEPHPILKGQFWWRTILREYLSSGKFHHPVPDEAPKEWEEQATKDYENGYESETSAIDKFMVADEAGEVYVWVKDEPSKDVNETFVCMIEKRGDGEVTQKPAYAQWLYSQWITEEGWKVIEWLSPAPPSGEDAGKGWISVEKENMPLETDLIVKHPFGVEAIHFFNAEWTFWYTGKSCGSDLIKSITHWKKP